MERVLQVQRRLYEIGKRYRATVPKKERSYRRWLQFLNDYEPVLVMGSVDGNAEVYEASKKHRDIRIN